MVTTRLCNDGKPCCASFDLLYNEHMKAHIYINSTCLVGSLATKRASLVLKLGRLGHM